MATGRLKVLVFLMHFILVFNEKVLVLSKI